MIFILKKQHDPTPVDRASKDTCILYFGYANVPSTRRNRFLKHERYICDFRSYDCSVFETNNKLSAENTANNKYINKKIKNIFLPNTNQKETIRNPAEYVHSGKI